jgi:NADH-quinone oxidoreductase subunit G
LQTSWLDIVPRAGEADDILLNADRNPNTTGAKLLQVAAAAPGERLRDIVGKVNGGEIRALICLGEDAMECGITAPALANLDCLITLGILPSAMTAAATVSLPGAGFAEKRGSMVNIKGRLQRLNRATNPPGEARDDWEILRDLIQALTGTNGIYMVEDVFKAMAGEVPAFAGLSLSKIGDLGVQVVEEQKEQDVPQAPVETDRIAPPTK